MGRKTKVKFEMKIAAVEDYLAGNGSLRDISMKYGLCSKNLLQTWIMKYNGHEEIKSSVKEERSNHDRWTNYTTLEEYCIENDKNYSETSRKYQVSF